jgi:hypothetical protein
MLLIYQLSLIGSDTLTDTSVPLLVKHKFVLMVTWSLFFEKHSTTMPLTIRCSSKILRSTLLNVLTPLSVRCVRWETKNPVYQGNLALYWAKVLIFTIWIYSMVSTIFLCFSTAYKQRKRQQQSAMMRL